MVTISSDSHLVIKSVVRNGLIIAAITILLFLCTEVLIQQSWPQFIEISDVNGERLERQDSYRSLGMRDSRLGFRYRPNAHLVYTGPEYSAEYVINEDGMRDESQHLAQPPSDVTRILLLGDSFTFGQGVNYAQIWPVVFEKRLLENGYF